LCRGEDLVPDYSTSVSFHPYNSPLPKEAAIPNKTPKKAGHAREFGISRETTYSYLRA